MEGGRVRGKNARRLCGWCVGTADVFCECEVSAGRTGGCARHRREAENGGGLLAKGEENSLRQSLLPSQGSITQDAFYFAPLPLPPTLEL